MCDNGLHPDALQLGDRQRQGDGPDDVRASGLFAIGGPGPHDVVDRHHFHRAAAARVRLTLLKYE